MAARHDHPRQMFDARLQIDSPSWFCIYVVSLSGMVFFISYILQSLHQAEKRTRSAFFEEHVSHRYDLPFPDKERLDYDRVRDKVWQRINKGGTELAFYAGLEEKDRTYLLKSLRPVLVKSIHCQEKALRDKRIMDKLYDHKLISERLHCSLLACEEENRADIAEAKNEVEAIRPGYYAEFYDICVSDQRRKKKDMPAAEAKLKKVHEQRSKHGSQGTRKERKGAQGQKAFTDKEKKHVSTLTKSRAAHQQCQPGQRQEDIIASAESSRNRNTSRKSGRKNRASIHSSKKILLVDESRSPSTSFPKRKKEMPPGAEFRGPAAALATAASAATTLLRTKWTAASAEGGGGLGRAELKSSLVITAAA